MFLSFINKEHTNENKVVCKEVAEIIKVVKVVENDNLNSNLEKESSNTSNNIDFLRKSLYKGTLNGTIKILLYITEQQNPCGGNLTILNGMYKYENQEKWILLNITLDKQKKNYCMVEDNFTGVLFLEENNDSFTGSWLSKDTKKQFKVELKDQLLDVKFAKDHTTIEKLDEILFDDLLFNKNDC
jgi:ATP-dependent protease HslVU (ClpYQ) ATPase subunit